MQVAAVQDALVLALAQLQKPTDGIMEQEELSQEHLIHASLLCNGYDVYHHWFQSIGFRNQTLKYGHVDKDHPSIALEYLVNSRTSRNDAESDNSVELFLSDIGLMALSLMSQEDVDEQQKIPLIQGPILELELGRALSQRRSVRNYTGDPLGFDYLSTLLRAANGVTAEATAPLSSGKAVKMNYRTAPSAGGLYPVDIYVGAVHVTDLKRGIYRYNPHRDCLVPFLESDAIDPLLQACAFQDELLSVKRSNVVLLMMSRPWKSMRKYGNRGLRFIYQEVGSISQNIHLASTALGLGSVDCAGFYENEVHKLFGVDGVNQAMLHTVVIGVPG